MPNVRNRKKRLVGAHVSDALHAAVERWRAMQDKPKSVTQFLLEAAKEKLDREGIHVDPHDVFDDGRFAKAGVRYGSRGSSPSELNDKGRDESNAKG